MTATRWMIAAVLTLGITSMGAAQREGREPLRPTVRAILKSVDAKAGTIAATVGEGRQGAEEKTFALAKDAEIATGEGFGRRAFSVLKEAKLSDLVPGAVLGLTLCADQKTIDTLVADGPTVHGTLKAVDPANKLVTIETRGAGREAQPEDKTYTLAANAEIGIDDGRRSRFSLTEGKPSDLVPGAQIAAQLSVDQKSIQSVTVEGLTISGLVKALDPKKNSITISTARGREEPEERTVDLTKDTVAITDDGKGRRLSLKEAKPSDIPVGSIVHLRLSLDQKTVTLLRAEGPPMWGMLKSADAAKGTITIATRMARGDNPEEKALTLAKDARIIFDGKPIKLGDIKVEENGLFVQLRLSLDQKTVQSLMVAKPRE